MPSGFKIASAYVDVHLDRTPLSGEMAELDRQLQSDTDRAGKSSGERLGRGLGDGADGAGTGRRIGDDIDRTLQPRAEQAGVDSGDKLSQGMQSSLIANSPLIAAALAGTLTAGAPALLGAAGSLFIAIAAVAEHSNTQMQLEFNQTKSTITSTFTDAAQVTVPFFVAAMGRISSAVQALGPQLKDAFSSLGGPIGLLTTGLINLANNAMPGIVSAVKSAGPVFQGLASMLGSIGTGIGQMFSILSEHSGAAGQVFAQLGQVIGSLLPIIGQLLGAGAELASHVLPPVVAVLHGLATALDAVAPALAPVLTGFLGFKAVGMLAGPLTLLSAKLQTVAADGGRLTTVLAGRGAAAASAFGSALLPIAAGVAALSAAFMASSAQLDDWAKGLEQGGQAAAIATQQLQDAHTRSIASAHSLNDAWGIVKGAFSDGLAQIEGYSSAQDKATQKSKEYYNSLDPLGKAQYDVTQKQNDYNYAVGKWGALSGQAIGAAVAYQDATQHEKDVQDQLTQAIHGVTQAMIDQANQALASADSQFAYQRDVLATKDAELAVKDAIQQHGATSEDAQKATIGFGQALLGQAEAAGKAAADTSGLTDQTDLARVSQQATLRELLNLKQQYGSEFPASLQNTIDRLQAAGVKLDDVGSKQPTPQVNLNDAPFQGVLSYVNGAIQTLHGQKPTPTAFMSTQPFQGAAAWMDGMLTYLNGRHVTPSALLIANTLAAEQAIDAAARNRTVYISAVYNVAPVGAGARVGAIGGRISDLLPAKKMSIGGQVRGPGGPTGDKAGPFLSSNGFVWLSDREQVIQERSARKYGDAKMAAVNAGTASITIPGQGRAQGGVVSQASPSDSGGVSGGIVVQSLTLSFPNVLTLADKELPRQLLEAFQDGLQKLEASRR